MASSVKTLDNEGMLKGIKESFDIDVLKRVINEMSVVAWDNRMERPHPNRWLNNFRGNVLGDQAVEQIIAIWLLMNFTFYTEKEVRALCRCIFEDFMHVALKQYEDEGTMQQVPITDRIQHVLATTIFLPLGNASESGTNILYYFRQENKLSKKSFEYKKDLEYKNLVYIDDVTISGSQADLYIKEKKLRADSKYILTFIATNDANTYLAKHQPEYRLISSIMLDERSKCFSTDSFAFSGVNSEILYELARQMCSEYGREIFPANPLGYDDGQYLFGFYYNTPDNTLPIIWRNSKSWEPAFLRYHKQYGEMEAVINESKYF